MGTFSDFLASKNINEEQLLRRSARIEHLRAEDREINRKREAHRRSKEKTSYEEAGIPKPRSGRSVQKEHIRAAKEDRPIPGPVRTKMVRALSSLTKDDSLDVSKIFGDVPGKQGKKPR